MNKNSTIHVRVNENVRANAEETLSMLGMTISDAVNMLLHQVNLVGGLPFDLKIPASARNIVRNSAELHQKLDEAESDFKAWKDNHYRASLKTRLIKEKTDRWQLQGNLPKACCRTPREVDAADVVHSCFFSKGVFRDALYKQMVYRERSWSSS